jgi:polar amino acid transport system substrate-binding protein
MPMWDHNSAAIRSPIRIDLDTVSWGSILYNTPYLRLGFGSRHCVGVSIMITRSLVRSVLVLAINGLFLLNVGCNKTPNPIKSTDPARPLVWAADYEGGAPYVAKDPNNPDAVVGFEKDIADAMAKELGRPIEFKEVEWESIIPGLVTRKSDYDFGMNGIEVTPANKAKVRFTRPYYVYRQQLVGRADEKRFSSYEDVKKQKDLVVGTLGDSAANQLLIADGVKTKTYKDSVSPYKDLQIGRIDAVLQDLPISIYLVQKKDEVKDKLKFIGTGVAPGVYAIAFRPADEELAKQVDAALEKLIKSGELKKILTKWELWNDDQANLDKGDEAEVLKGLK